MSSVGVSHSTGFAVRGITSETQTLVQLFVSTAVSEMNV